MAYVRIQFRGLAGAWGGGLAKSAADISPPILGTPNGQAERGIPKQDLLWLQIQASDQHQGVATGASGSPALGISGAW